MSESRDESLNKPASSNEQARSQDSQLIAEADIHESEREALKKAREAEISDLDSAGGEAGYGNLHFGEQKTNEDLSADPVGREANGFEPLLHDQNIDTNSSESQASRQSDLTAPAGDEIGNRDDIAADEASELPFAERTSPDRAEPTTPSNADASLNPDAQTNLGEAARVSTSASQPSSGPLRSPANSKTNEQSEIPPGDGSENGQQTDLADTNAAPTSLTLSGTSVDENDVGAVIATLSSSDPDVGDSATYALSEDISGFFEVVGNELRLKDGVALDHEDQDSYEVTLTVTDSTGASFEQTVTIDVADVNEGPTSLTLSDTDVDENEEGAVVATLSSTDVDDGDSAIYALSDDTSGLFEVVGNELKLKDGVALDHETQDSYTVTLTVTDASGASFDQTVNIDVSDVNEGPTSLILSDTNVDENAAGVTVATLSSTDVDEGDSATYALSEDSSGLFEVVGNELKLKDGVSLDHEGQDAYELTLIVTDNAGASFEQIVTIDVADVNESPADIVLSGNDIDENEVGAIVGTLSTADVDGGDSHVYEVSDERFEVVDGNLKLKDGVSLDHETAATIDVTVTATDTGGLASTQEFSVNVADVNEVPTTVDFISTRQVNIENAGFEDRAHGDQQWGRGAEGWESTGSSGDWNPASRSLSAEASEGENVAYINSGTLSQTLGEAFSDSGYYTLSVDVGNRQDIGSFGDYEIRLFAGDELIGTADGGAPAEGEWGTVSLDVSASDFPDDFAGFGESLRIELVKESGGQVNFDNVQLTVTDPGADLNVPENHPGAQIAILSTIDPDEGDSHSYTVSDDRFEVVDGALKLKDGVSLNHEEAASVQFVITATDNDGLSVDQDFSLQVGDVNEAPSDLALSGSSVGENDAGATIGALSINDVDNGDGHVFTVSDDRFEVVDGNLKLKDGVSLNHENAENIDLVVTATDNGGLATEQTFSISVGDENEAPTDINFNSTRDVQIDNAGFENREHADQSWGRGAEDWESTGASGDWNPAQRSLAAEASEGDNVAYINSGTLSQTLGEEFSATTNYELSVDVGNRQDIGGYGDYEIRLYAGDELIGTADGGAPAEGDWETVSLQVNGADFPDGFTGFGENIRIELVKEGGGQVNFDNVRMTASEQTDPLSINENDFGANVGAINVVDEDQGDTHTFVVSDDRFEVVGGALKLKDGVSLDHEVADTIDVIVTATDAGGLSTSSDFSISVANVNEAPIDFVLEPNETHGALSLNQSGDNDDLAIASNVEGFPTDALTVEVTFTSSQTDIGSGVPLFSYAANGGHNNEALIWLESSSGKLNVFLAGRKFRTDIDNDALLDGEEHQVSFTWDQASDQLNVYVDGVNEFNTSVNVRDLKTDGTVTLGQEQDTEGGRFDSNQTFEGEISEVRVFDHARNADEIANNVDAPLDNPGSIDGLVTNWVMNNSENGVVSDLAGGNDLVLQNGAEIVGGETYATPTVAENVEGGTIGTLSAIDPDSDAPITDFTIADDPSGLFEIVGNELKLKSGVSADFEAQDSYEIVLRASDDLGLSTETTVTINVADVNEAPLNIELSNSVVNENDAGATIATLSSTDPDAGDSATYALSEDTSGLFEVVGNELKLKVGASLDHEGQDSYEITLSVTDNAGESFEQTVSIDVADVNEGPTSLTLSDTSVDENDAGAVVATLSSSDVDDGDTASYALNDDASGLFEVVGNELKLKDGVSLDHETQDAYEVTLTVTDSAGESFEQTVTIDVADVNDAPTAVQLSSNSVGESVDSGGNIGAAVNQSGVVVGDLSITDQDGDAASQYQLSDADGNPVDHPQFEIVGNQVVVKSGAVLDYEATPTVDVYITATDSGGASTTQSFTLELTDSEGSFVGDAGNDVARGTSEEDNISGGEGNDYLAGNDGNDTISGDGGNDRIIGGGGADELHGGSGDDLIYADGDDTAVTGGEGSDRVIVQGDGDFSIDQTASSVERVDGGAGNDQMDATGMTDRAIQLGNGGDDTLTGGSGNDVQRGGDGNDVVYGDDGNDNIQGNAGADELHGGAGNDLIYADGDDTAVTGGEGTDRVIVQGDGDFTIDQTASSVERVDGGAGNDQMDATGMTDRATQLGNGGDDTLTGGSGNDVQRGGDGNDVVYGGDGNDNIQGNAGADELHGGAGNDLIYADSEDTAVTGGEGTDRVIVQGDGDFTIDQTTSSVERVDGGTGNDQMDATGMTDRATQLGNDGDDTLTGGSGNDVQRGGDGNDVVYGGDGNDNIQGNAGADELHGGAGNDLIYADSEDTAVTGGEGTDRVIVQGDGDFSIDQNASSVERVDGGTGNDQLDAAGMTDRATQLGNDGDDTLTGGSGNDVQRGGDGNDVVYGGDGNDNIQGNAGADELHGGAGNDLIYADSEDTAVTGGEGTDRVIVQGDGDFSIDQTASSVERVDGGTGNDQMDATGMTDRATQLGNGGDDTLTGGSGNDVQRGGDGNDVVAGGDGNDNMQGNDGTDRLIGGAGNDYIDGGEGNDTAVFSGDRADYTITQLGENDFRITDDRPGAPDGIDRVLNIENFEFSDGTVSVEHILNEAPTSLSLSDTNVDENDAGATVATLSSTDNDLGDSATFAISDDASGLFEVVGNELKLKDGVSLDHESQDSHEVTLTVTDDAGASFEQTVTIDVNDVDEATVVGDVDLGQTSEDTAVIITEAQLLAQSHDPEGAALSVTDASVDPAYGSLSDNGDGSWTFTPEQDLAVDDVPISFDVSDGASTQSAVASIDVAAVADAPTITLGAVTQEELGESNTVNSGFEIEGVDVSRSGSDWIGSLGDWETTSEAIEVKQETLADGSTNQFIELNDDAANYYDDATNIVRTIETEDGAVYTIDFENAARPGYDGSVNEIEVVINGEVVETISADGTGSSAINWESNSVTFVGDGSDATVEFRASGVAQNYGRGMFLDDVVITEELPVGHAAGDGQIALPEISVATTDSDGSETVSTVISDIPDGFMISDGTNTFTSTDGVDSVDISDWAQDQMMVTPSDGFTGEVSLNVTATSTDGADQTETTEAITVNVEPSDDVLTGSAGNDTIAGGGGDDTISGEGGNDILSGGSGDDIVNGDSGDDTITGGTGDDILNGGSGDDVFVYAHGDGSDVIDGGAGGGWTDAIQIEGGVSSLGSFGTDWTVELTEGSVTAQDSDSVTFSDDAAGSITFSDGTTVEFENLEQII